MARRKKYSAKPKGAPVWIITFSDLMTLLLTFFVLMVGMAVIDERSKRDVLGAVTKHFGVGQAVSNPTSKTDRESLDAPGRMEGVNEDDLEPLRDMVFDAQEKDLDFRENHFVQVFSINAEVLFEKGGYVLSRRGIQLLDKIVPYLKEVEFPVLVAGYTSVRREEEGESYVPDFDATKADSSWMLSFQRSHTVYRHFSERGVPAGRLALEGYGRFHPRFSNETPDGRQKNRRVDLILDKRNLAWIRKVEQLREQNPELPRTYHYQGFSFDLTLPGESRPEPNDNRPESDSDRPER